MAQEISFHPPHLIDSSGSLTPAALITFCSFQANMSMLGEMKEGLNFTACSKFKPTILEGQLCYSLNLNLIDKDRKQKTETGKGAGLVIILDTGMKQIDSMNSQESNENPLAFGSSGVDVSSARIYLNTLSSFTDHRAGQYAMSVLKKVTGTESFLKQTDEKKKCQTESLEDCQAKSSIYRIQKRCGCVPLALSSALVPQVLYFTSCLLKPFTFRISISAHPTPLPATLQF